MAWEKVCPVPACDPVGKWTEELGSCMYANCHAGNYCPLHVTLIGISGTCGMTIHSLQEHCIFRGQVSAVIGV
jgi:hypothetical protein